MPIYDCEITLDAHGREIQHATASFPLSCCRDDLSRTPVPWHWHDELEAAVVLEGVALLEMEDGAVQLPAGSGFFLNAGALHAVRAADGSGCRMHSITFLKQLVGGEGDSVFWQKYLRPLSAGPSSLILHPDVPWQAAVMKSVEDAWQACADEEAGYEFEARNALSRFVFLLSENLPLNPRPVQAHAALRRDERIKCMLKFMEENMERELRVAEIAASAAVSESECLRCFRQVIGASPVRYLRRLRLQRAAELLTATEATVSEIGAACGFPDASFFIRSFRERYGQTPAAYRRLWRGGKA